MIQPDPLMGGSRERLSSLPSIGAYSLHEHRNGNDFQDFVSIYCRSEDVPIGMDIRFPDQKQGVTDKGAPQEHEEPEYNLRWISGIPMDIVIQIIQETGEEHDAIYICQPEEKEIMAATGNMRAGRDLDEIITPRFTVLGAKSSGLRLFWVADKVVAPDGPEFILATEGNRPVTDPDIPPLLHKTMSSRHRDKIGASLENLAAIYERFRNGPPRPQAT